MESADGLPVRVEVNGLAETLSGEGAARLPLAACPAVFPIRVETENVGSDLESPAVAGRYRVDADRIVFEPAFPFRPGVRYRAVFRPAALPGSDQSAPPDVTSAYFRKAPPAEPATRVTAIHPSADVVPENLLKFYLQFSAPMSRGGIYRHITLRTESGQTVELPFLEIDEELWDPAMSRLTLFLDPGRIKRGVQPLEEVGPSLQAGGTYILRVDRAWQDAQGAPLVESFEKAFRVAGPDRDPPDPARWKVRPPSAGGREPLFVEFPEPMDSAITRRTLKVTGPNGDGVSGRVELQDGERRWVLVPDQPWLSGRHQLRYPSLLEDLAGNNVGKVFDVDVFEQVDSRPSQEILETAFDIR